MSEKKKVRFKKIHRKVEYKHNFRRCIKGVSS